MSELDFNPGGSSDDTDVVSDTSSSTDGKQDQDLIDNQDIVQEKPLGQDVPQPNAELEPKDELDGISTELENVRLEITQKSFLQDSKKKELDETIKSIPEEKKWLVKQTKSFNEERKERESQGLQETRILIEKNMAKRRNLFNKKSLEREKEYLEESSLEDEESLKSAKACIKGSSLNEEALQLEKELDILRKREVELKEEKIEILLSKCDDLIDEVDFYSDEKKKDKVVLYWRELISEGYDDIGRFYREIEEDVSSFVNGSTDLMARLIIEDPSNKIFSAFDFSSRSPTQVMKVYNRVFEKGGKSAFQEFIKNLEITEEQLFCIPKVAADIFREDPERAMELLDGEIKQGWRSAMVEVLSDELGFEIFKGDKEKFMEILLSLHYDERAESLMGNTGLEILSSNRGEFSSIIKALFTVNSQGEGRFSYSDGLVTLLGSPVGLKMFLEDRDEFLDLFKRFSDHHASYIISKLGVEMMDQDYQKFVEIFDDLEDQGKVKVLSGPFGEVLAEKHEEVYIDFLSKLESYYTGGILASRSGLKMFFQNREVFLDFLRKGGFASSHIGEILCSVGDVLFKEEQDDFLEQYKLLASEDKAGVLIKDWALELLEENPKEYIELLVPLAKDYYSTSAFDMVIREIQNSEIVKNKKTLSENESISFRLYSQLISGCNGSELRSISYALDRYISTFNLDKERVFSYLIADIQKRRQEMNGSRTEVEEVPGLIRSLVKAYPHNASQRERFLWNSLVRELPFEGDSTLMAEMRRLALDVERFDQEKLEWVHQSVHNYADIRELPYLVSFRKLLLSSTEAEFLENKEVFDRYRAYYHGLPEAPDYQMSEILELQNKEGLLTTLDNLISKVDGFYFGGNDNLRALLGLLEKDLSPELIQSSKELVSALDNLDKEIGGGQGDRKEREVAPQNILQALGKINDFREILLQKLDPSGDVELNETLLKLSMNLDGRYRSVLTHGKSWLESLEGLQGIPSEKKRIASLLLLETLRAGEISGEFPSLGEDTLRIKEKIEKGSLGQEDFNEPLPLSLIKRNIRINDSWMELVKDIDKHMNYFLSDKYMRVLSDNYKIDSLVKMHILVDLEKKSLLYNYQPIYNLTMDILQKSDNPVIEENIVAGSTETLEKVYKNEVQGSEQAIGNPEVIRFIDQLKESSKIGGSSLEAASQKLTEVYNLEESHVDRILSGINFLDYKNDRRVISFLDGSDEVEILPIEYNGVSLSVLLINGKRVTTPVSYFKNLLQKRGYSGNVESVIQYTKREGD